MTALRLIFLLLLTSAAAQTGEPDYDAELQRAMKLYPPGDYNEAPVRRFSPTTAIETLKVPATFDLLQPVSPSGKDIPALGSEAAELFTSGRWDLSVKRYRQLLLADPDNTNAKAHLFDILLLRSLYGDAAHREEAARMHREMRERLAREILPRK